MLKKKAYRGLKVGPVQANNQPPAGTTVRLLHKSKLGAPTTVALGTLAHIIQL